MADVVLSQAPNANIGAQNLATDYIGGLQASRSLMDQAEANRRANVASDQQQQLFNILQPVHQAQSRADIAAAQNTLESNITTSNARAAALQLAPSAQQAFDGILKITDAQQRVQAGLQWVNDYGQLANVKELQPQFAANHDLVAKMYSDYNTQRTLQNQLNIAKTRNQVAMKTPYMKLIDAYDNAKDVDPQTAGMLKAQIDKQNAFLPPDQRNEMSQLLLLRNNPPPGVDPSVIDARIEQLTGRTLQSTPGAPAPAAPTGGAPVSSAPIQQDPQDPDAVSAQPATVAAAAPTQPSAPMLTAGAPRLQPAVKTQAQESLAKLTSLVAQGGELMDDIKGHPEYLGVRGSVGSMISDSALPAIGINSYADQGRVSVRQKIGIYRDSVLKTIADLPRVSQAEISDIKSNMPDTGFGSNLAADITKLQNVVNLLSTKAKESATLLGQKVPDSSSTPVDPHLINMSPAEIKSAFKAGKISRDQARGLLNAMPDFSGNPSSTAAPAQTPDE